MDNYTYISSLDVNKISLYTLQLSNMKRIEENDAVYIFDEVGAGKTISAGLCTIQLLFQHMDKEKFRNVLIITAPSVVEQFAHKFEDVLELQVGHEGNYNNKDYNIKVINYDYRNIRKFCGKYDFIIIDEAHEFLNERTKRYEELVKLKAKKILFLTATPIKYSKSDLESYPKIASEIISIDYKNLKEQLLDACYDKERLSSGFNPLLPVTRYFKETVRNIEKTEDGKEFMDKEPRRLIPELWEYEYDQDAKFFLVEKIESNYNGKNKFVVFVRFREDAKKISEAFSKKEYYNYLLSSEAEKTFCIVTGETENRRELLKKFSTINSDIKIPDVLILTYKISEQGIDLPAYNYTINYHIPASPSQLEQRFGRIDRLNSLHDELSTCFILKRNSYTDINTTNFYTAVSTYINEFLPLIPSKNCLITSKILENFSNNTENIVTYYTRLLEKCNDNSVIYEVYNKVSLNESYDDFYNENYNLMSFIEDRNVEFDEDIELYKKNIIKEIERCINQARKSQERIKWWKDNIDLLSNDLFYINTNDDRFDWSKKYHIDTINPKSAAKDIVRLPAYISFSDEVKIPIERMRIWNYNKDYIELDIEEAFHANQFDKIFPDNGDFLPIWIKYFSSKQDIITLEKVNEYMGTLPFYKMCEEYKRIVQGYAYNDKGYLYQNYDFNPFSSSIGGLFNRKIKWNLSSKFFNNYFDNNGNIIGNLFYVKNENGLIKSSNWLKLFYKYSRKEVFAIGRLKSGYVIDYSENPKVVHTGDTYGYIKESFLRIDFIYKDIENITLKMKNSEEKYSKVLNDYKAMLKEHYHCAWSLFNYFLYTMNNKERKYTKNAIFIEGYINLLKSYDNKLTLDIINDMKPAEIF